MQEYSKALEADPTATTFKDRGDAYQYAGNIEAAIKDYQAAIDMDPGSPEAAEAKKEIARLKGTP